MAEITLGPERATSMADLSRVTIDGETFSLGDTVWVEHLPSRQKIFGTLRSFYGVGRIRGLNVSAPYVGTVSFPFGQPGDAETYRMTKLEA